MVVNLVVSHPGEATVFPLLASGRRRRTTARSIFVLSLGTVNCTRNRARDAGLRHQLGDRAFKSMLPSLQLFWSYFPR